MYFDSLYLPWNQQHLAAKMFVFNNLRRESTLLLCSNYVLCSVSHTQYCHQAFKHWPSGTSVVKKLLRGLTGYILSDKETGHNFCPSHPPFRNVPWQEYKREYAKNLANKLGAPRVVNHMFEFDNGIC